MSVVLPIGGPNEAAPEIVGESAAVKGALALAARFARSDLPILLVGETGTGKELFAQHIHALSGRRGRKTAVNCAALPEDMAESLLFGHRRGAFTGAMEHTAGYLETADRGTLFLDELTSLPYPIQAKLLRVLDAPRVRRLGEQRERVLDFRVIAAAQPELYEHLARGKIRRDLYQRLSGVIIRLAPLTQRRDDLVPLARHFAAARGRVLTRGTEAVLLAYDWPGNVRELRAAVTRAMHLAPEGVIDAAALAEAISLGAPDGARAPAPARPPTPRERLEAAGGASGWDAGRMAKALGVSRATLFRWLRAEQLSLRARRWPGASGPRPRP
jgi:transcriptional regulator, propionate catabolism operon regulatory protein